MFIYKFPSHSYFQQSPGGAGQGDVGVGEVDEGGEALVEVFGSYLFVYPLVRAAAAEGVAAQAAEASGPGPQIAADAISCGQVSAGKEVHTTPR